MNTGDNRVCHGNSASYSEMAYFDGNHCAHCAARDEFNRLEWLKKRTMAAIRARVRA